LNQNNPANDTIIAKLVSPKNATGMSWARKSQVAELTLVIGGESLGASAFISISVTSSFDVYASTN
jgi:hypothetical protein